MAQLIRASASEMCRVEHHRFESQPTLSLFIITNYYPVLYEFSVLLFYHISAQVTACGQAYGNWKKNPGLFKKNIYTITLKHVAYGKTIVFSKCVPHRIVGRFRKSCIYLTNKVETKKDKCLTFLLLTTLTHIFCSFR